MKKAFLILMALGGLAGGLAAQEMGKRYALLVGVEDYQHPKLREPTPIKYSVDDVTALGKLLTADGFEVALLTDELGKTDPRQRPNKANVEAKLQELARKCRDRDTLLIALAGHGLQFAGSKDAYFCPSDARPFADETDTLVSVSKIYAELEKSFAGVKVILVDACRNDPDPGRGRGLDADSAPAPPKGVAALFSCSAGQRAFEHDLLQHGVFFHYVLEGVRGKAANARGEVTFGRLAEFVGENVPEAVSKLVPGREQFPNLKADLVGRSPLLVRVEPPVNLPVGPARGAIVNSIGMKLAAIEPGAFQMGAPEDDEDRNPDETEHEVRITRPFLIGVYEVTQAEYQAVMGANPSYFAPGGKGAASLGGNIDTRRLPVDSVNYESAIEFCERLSARTAEVAAGRTYRLPTEAEWEYCCRAGSRTAFAFGAELSERQANIGAFSPKPVGSYKPNAFGLYDMHGNVWEWCSDYYGKYTAGPVDDPQGPATGTDRVMRGGGYDASPEEVRSAFREHLTPLRGTSTDGFRVVCETKGN